MGFNTRPGRIRFQPHEKQNNGEAPFEIVYTKLPCLTVDLTNVPSSVDFSLEAEKVAERITITPGSI